MGKTGAEVAIESKRFGSEIVTALSAVSFRADGTTSKAIEWGCRIEEKVNCAGALCPFP